jgi:hypothetical protein
MENLLRIENDGAEIIETNFFDSDLAKKGGCYLSTNACAFRLLVPDSRLGFLSDMRTAREVLVTRGAWPAMKQSEAMEILFEDDTNEPFMLILGAPQVERFPTPEDEGRELPFTVWTRGPVKAETFKAYYRKVNKLPYMKARNK